jgi:hypothetical protein
MDHAVLASMASLELCTDRMSGFMGSDKPSSFYNYYVKPHLPASCGAFTFGGRMRPMAKTSSREQESNFDIVETAAEGGALGHGVTRVSSRVLAFSYRLLFRCKNSDVSNSNL